MKMAKINMVDALNSALDIALKDEDVIILGEDVGKEGGVFRVTKGLQEKYGSERVVDTPLAELAIVGTSTGMAINGMKPICEIQFSGFLHLALDQLLNYACRMRNRSRGKYTVPLVVRTPYSGGIRALEHHSESFEAIYAHVPGLIVVIPSNPYDAKGLLLSAIKCPDPVLFMEPKRIYRAIKQEVPEEEYVVPLGKAKIVQEGDKVTLIGYGAMVRECMKAADDGVEIIDLRTISPLDVETIIKSVKKTGRCVIVHEGPKSFGVAGEIIAIINEKCLTSLEAPVERVTGYDTVFPLYKNEKQYLPDERKIRSAIENVLNF